MSIEENGCKINFDSNVFFNASHVTDRDITLILLKRELKSIAIEKESKSSSSSDSYCCLDAFSGSGIRSLRAILENNTNITSNNSSILLKQFAIDYDDDAIKRIKSNASLNNISIQYFDSNDKVDWETIINANSSTTSLNSKNTLILFKGKVLEILSLFKAKFDFVDLDPFGSVSKYLPLSIKHTSNLE
jgi:tRNA G26 N,N-dimethylase Trm1